MNTQGVVNLQLLRPRHHPIPIRRAARRDDGVLYTEAFCPLPQRFDVLVEDVDLQVVVRVDPADFTHEFVPKGA